MALAFDRFRPLGTTDSEHAYCALLERIQALCGSSALPPPLDRRIQSTGQILPPGLFLLERRCAHADQVVRARGVSVAAGLQEVLLIASVHLSDEKWRPFAEIDLVPVSAGRLVGSCLA